MKKISIIIPVYNAEQFLKRCIDSVLNQTYKNVEIILINDGSKDSSKKICEEYVIKDERVKLINEENYGVSHARNIGIDNASGDYIFFLDADDWIDNDTIEILLNKVLEMNADIIKVNYYNSFQKSEEKNDIKELIGKYDNKKIETEEYNNVIQSILANSFYLNVVWGELIKKEKLKEIRFDENLIYGEDLLFNFQLLMIANDIVFINDAYYHYYINYNGANQNYDFKVICKKIDNLNYIYEKLFGIYESKKQIALKYLKEITENSLKLAISKNQKKEIKEKLNEIINTDFFYLASKNIDKYKFRFKYKLAMKLLIDKRVTLFMCYSIVIYRNFRNIKNAIKRKK